MARESTPSAKEAETFSGPQNGVSVGISDPDTRTSGIDSNRNISVENFVRTFEQDKQHDGDQSRTEEENVFFTQLFSQRKGHHAAGSSHMGLVTNIFFVFRLTEIFYFVAVLIIIEYAFMHTNYYVMCLPCIV